MSSIVIQGDTSGSITVEAPSVAGTHTLTLPKATGNIATDATVGLGVKNLIINGDMRIAQRATSVTGSTASSAYISLDRWASHSSGATYNISQQSVTVGGESGLPVVFTKYLRFNPTIGANNCGIWQTIEDVDRVQQTFTLSFYAKGTNPDGGSIGISLLQNFGSGGSTSVSLVDEKEFTLTSSWQRFTFTITPQSIVGKTIGTSSYYRIFFNQKDTDNGTGAWTLDITGVQLEVGENATPFENRMYGTELALCQRYYQKSYDDGVSPGTTSTSGQVNHNFLNLGNYGNITQAFSVPMRAAPTMTVYDGTSGASGTIRYWDGSAEVTRTSNFTLTASPKQWNMADTVFNHTNIIFQWTASAEL